MKQFKHMELSLQRTTVDAPPPRRTSRVTPLQNTRGYAQAQIVFSGILKQPSAATPMPEGAPLTRRVARGGSRCELRGRPAPAPP
jgi:hypothetical protein